MARSDKYTSLTNKPIFYSDFTNNLDVNQSTGILSKITNEKSVMNSVRNIIFTRNGERFFQPTIGSKINSILFEPMDSPTALLLKNTISEAIKNNEPRAEIKNLEVIADPDRNAYLVKLVFNIINIPEDINFNFYLDRVR
jgi:phage baseplate assembly protein W